MFFGHLGFVGMVIEYFTDWDVMIFHEYDWWGGLNIDKFIVMYWHVLIYT